MPRPVLTKYGLGGTLWVLGLAVVAIPVLVTAAGHLKQFVDAGKNNSKLSKHKVSRPSICKALILFREERGYEFYE